MATYPSRRISASLTFVIVLAALFLQACSSGSGGGGGGGNPPAAPTGLSATAGAGQVALAWTGSSGATSYNVKRGTATGGPYTTIASPSGTSYTDTSVTGGTKYYYVVTASNSNGESGSSNEASATPTVAVPPAPTGLAATPSDKQVALTWNASSGATKYNVKRGTTTGGPYTTVGSPTTTNFTDTGLTDGTKYYYVVTAVNTAGESSPSSEVSATPIAPPAAPTGLAATPGDKQVALTWNASTGAASYNVKRGTVHGGPYTTVNSPTGTSYTDAGLTDGTTYYYVVTAVNAGGESGNSNEASATPAASASVHVTVDVLANRHTISQYVYGGAFPKDAATITDSGLPVVRWGGNGASTYNWQLGTTNADNDYFFEDFTFGALNNSADSDSRQFIKDVKAAGSAPLMTMVMLPWVAQSPETSVQQGTGPNNYHWTFSVSQDGACSAAAHVDKYNTDAGVNLMSDCSTKMVASTAQLNRTYFQLLDDHTGTCNVAGTCVYRNDWATALATAFGSTVPHFYNMDNEIDIWGGTHVDVHPNPTTYNELRDVFVNEARSLKTWDPAAVRFGPVSCCWYFYWRSATGGSDTSSHGGVDFLPWWLNEVAWSDAVAGTRSLDVFDIHAYPDADTNGLSTAQLKALAVSIYRDWWDPTFPSAAAYIRSGGFSIEPVDSHPFRIPRMRALVNQIYPGTQFSITEWSAEFNGASDFSTALGDADAYGVLGRERVYLSTRWTAPDPTTPNPNYLALKLYTNYDAAHHGFAPMSVSATNDGDPGLFSSYAAVNSAGTSMTLMILNKDPQNSVTAGLNLNGFTPGSVTTYTLAASAPTTITKATPLWSSTMTFAPYSATLLVIAGSMASTPADEWDLNPDTIMVPAGGTVTLNPKLTSGTASVNLSSAMFDAYEGATACTSATLSITTSTITPGATGAIDVTAGTTPGFCHFTVTGSDSGATQTQGGWIVVGNPAATLAKTGGDGQTGTHGTTLPNPLTVTLTPGSSGGAAAGASVLFTTSAGSLTNVLVGTEKVYTGSKVIAVTNSSGVASVTLTLPSTTGKVTVTAEGPYGLGHPEPSTPFMETSN